jgi:hypothetical protein
LRVSSEHRSNGSSSVRQLTHDIRWSPPLAQLLLVC